MLYIKKKQKVFLLYKFSQSITAVIRSGYCKTITLLTSVIIYIFIVNSTVKKQDFYLLQQSLCTE